MNALLVPLVVLCIALVAAGESLLIYHHGKWLVASANAASAGPLAAAIAAPLVALIAAILTFLAVKRKYELDTQLEETKQRLGERYKRQSDAFLEIWKAVNTSFRKLKQLEQGPTNGTLHAAIQATMEPADDYSFAFDADMDLWFYEFWQQAVEIAAAADKLPATPGASKALWHKHVKAMDALRSKIKERCYQRYFEPG